MNRKSIEARKNKLSYDSIPISGLSFLIENDCPRYILDEVAKAFNEGAEKYGKLNFTEEKLDLTDYYNAFMRHLIPYSEGEYIDIDSNINHLSKFISGGLVVIDALNSGNINDSRIPQAFNFPESTGIKKVMFKTMKWYGKGDVDIKDIILEVIKMRKEKWKED